MPLDRELLREGAVAVEVSHHVTETGQRLRIRSVGRQAVVDLDPFELEGLTRLPFTPFAPLEEARDDVDQDVVLAAPDDRLEILRNEFAMVGVSVADGPDGRRLRVRNMGSGAEVRLRAGQLDRLTELRHQDLAPLVDPSGLSSEEEPDPDQV